MNVIVDYGLGNLKSVQKAFKKANIETIISNKPLDLEKAKFIILPGVGAFRDAIKSLKENKLDEIIKKHAGDGKYLVGICLGMQLLYSKSYEYGEYEGLDILKGNIAKLEKAEKIPHMGWNNLKFYKNDYLLKYVKENEYVYFVHSYYADSNFSEVLAYTEYGEKIPAIVKKNNVYGFQFHPEKSSKAGENLLKALGEIINDNNTGN